jgi:hypothetical protein
MFDLLVHADWSSNHQKRWMATAESHGGVWEVDAPRPVPAESELLDDLIASGRKVLAGFDFPIGLPVAFGKQTGLGDFVSALSVFGFGEWHRFFDVADRPEEISLRRPFYPNTCVKGRKQAHLFGPLGVSTIDELLRQCERKSDFRPAACSLFWTLGGNQVGKAAISGWQHVVRPALARGARLWPFHGQLQELSRLRGCVICETYPREAFGHLGVKFGPKQSKRRQGDRRIAARPLIDSAKRFGVSLTARAEDALVDGFGLENTGEDSFDAFVGVLSMIEVVDGRRSEGGISRDNETAHWEGWILGQQ